MITGQYMKCISTYTGDMQDAQKEEWQQRAGVGVVQVISGLGKRMSDESDHPGNRTNPGLLPRQAGCCPLQARLS